MNEQILLYYYETSGRLVFVRFLEEIEDTKKTFRNYLTFRGLILDNPQIFLFNFLLGFLSTSGYEEPAWWCFAVLGLCSMPAEPISMRNRAQFTTLLLHFSLYFSWASLPGSPFHINHKHIVHNSRGEGPVLYIVRLYSYSSFYTHIHKP